MGLVSTTRAAQELGLREEQLRDLLRRGIVKPPLRLTGGRSYLWSVGHIEEARKIIEARRKPAPLTPAS